MENKMSTQTDEQVEKSLTEARQTENMSDSRDGEPRQEMRNGCRQK